eukprot:5795408-Prymnesium_polylepis.1
MPPPHMPIAMSPAISSYFEIAVLYTRLGSDVQSPDGPDSLTSEVRSIRGLSGHKDRGALQSCI